jgi:WD40 repeat protein
LSNLATRKVIRRLKLPGPPINVSTRSTLTFSPDGAALLSATAFDPMIRVWDVTTGKEIRQFGVQHGKPPFLGGDAPVLALSPDGKRLAVAGSDQTIRFLDVGTGAEVHPAGGHQGRVSSIALSPDGKTIVTGSWDQTIRIWDAATGREIRAIRGQERPVVAVVYSPDGRTLASAGVDATIHIWDVATGQEVRRFKQQGDKPDRSGVFSLAFSPDGKTLAAGCMQSISVWNTVALALEGRSLSPTILTPTGSSMGRIAHMARQHIPESDLFDLPPFLWTRSSRPVTVQGAFLDRLGVCPCAI